MSSWKELSQAWQICIVSLTVICLIAVVTLIWTNVPEPIPEEDSDVYIYLIGQEHSYTIDQLKELAPIRSKIRIVPIEFPSGIPTIQDVDLLIKLFEWNYPENAKLYTVVAHNKGDGIGRNIMIDINFTPNSIKELEISNEERVSLIQGGKPTGTKAIFLIGELLPNERQDVEILVEGKDVPSVEVWSEGEGNIEKIFILDLVIEPDKDYKVE